MSNYGRKKLEYFSRVSEHSNKVDFCFVLVIPTKFCQFFCAKGRKWGFSSRLLQKVQKFLVYQMSTKNRLLTLRPQEVENWENMGCQPHVYQTTNQDRKSREFRENFRLFCTFQRGIGVSYSTDSGLEREKPERLSGVDR